MNAPPVPTFEEFSSDRVLSYFKLWELLKFEKDNPIQVYDEVEQTYVADEYNAMQLTLLTSMLELGQDEKNLSLGEQKLVTQFFKLVIDQSAFWSQDHVRIRKFLIDWYSSQRTIVTKSRNSIDPYSLSDEELNEVILGFGYPYPYNMDKDKKSVFLHELVGYYHKKGTPKVLGDVLTFYGLVDVVICEWWLYRDFFNKSFWVRSVPVWPATAKNNEEYISILPYEPFVRPDPFWHYDKGEGLSEERVEDLFLEPENPEDDPNDEFTERKNKITLPSITPYISLNTVVRDEYVKCETSIMNRKVQEAYEFWIEYILLWKGEYLFPSRFPLHPEANWVVFCTSSNTHWVYNGREWVDLGGKLPKSLVESEPDCFGHTTFEPIRDVGTTLYSEKISFLEAMVALTYILSSHFGFGCNRYEAVDSFNDLPIIPPPPENSLRRILDTDVDAMYFSGEWHQTGKWHDLGYTTNYDTTDGNYSLITYVPPDLSKTNYFHFSHLEYNGKHAPLDFLYFDSTEGYFEGCRDGIDDVNYDLIRQEYDEIIARPKDHPILEEPVGLHGTETRRYHTTWQQRNEKQDDLTDAFFRKYGVRRIEKIDYFGWGGYDSSAIHTGWWNVYGDSTSVLITLDPPNKGVNIYCDVNDMFLSYLFVSSEINPILPYLGIDPNLLLTGIIDIEFDIILNSGSLSFVMSQLMEDGSVIPTYISNPINVSQHVMIKGLQLTNILYMGFLRANSDLLEAHITNITVKENITEESGDSGVIDLWNTNVIASNVPTSNPETWFVGRMSQPGWISFSGEDGAVNCQMNFGERTFDMEGVAPGYDAGIGFVPYGMNGLVDPMEPLLPVPPPGGHSMLSFTVSDLLLPAGTSLYFFAWDGHFPVTYLVGDQITDKNTYWYDVDPGKALYVGFLFDGPTSEDMKITVKDFYWARVNDANVESTREHFFAYTHARNFLRSMNPQFWDAIEAEYYLLGLLYPDDERKFLRLQEKYMQDLGLYYKNIGLTHLQGLSNLILGLTLYPEIKKVINFFKPYRVRFRPLMTEYNINGTGNSNGDGAYVEDHIYIPRMTQKVQEVARTSDMLTMAPVLLFEECYYRYGYFLGGPGVYPAVFDGLCRGLLDDVFIKTKITFTDIVQVQESLLTMFDALTIDDVGPYNYDNLRTKDLLHDIGIRIIFIDDYAKNIFEVNYGDELDIQQYIKFIDTCVVSDHLRWSEHHILVEDYGPIYGSVDNSEFPFETSRTSDYFVPPAIHTRIIDKFNWIDLNDPYQNLPNSRFDLNVGDEGSIETNITVNELFIGPVTHRLNYVSMQSSPSRVDTVFMLPGYHSTDATNGVVSSGWYEIVPPSGVYPAGSSQWHFDENMALVSDIDTTNYIGYAPSTVYLTGLEPWDPGRRFGYFDISFDIEVFSCDPDPISFVAVSKPLTLGVLWTYGQLTVGRNILDNYVLPECIHGFGGFYITFNVATIKIHKLQIKHYVWNGQETINPTNGA